MSLVDATRILLVRQRRIFLTVFIAVLGAAAVLTFSLPDQYTTSSTLFVGENRPVNAGANAVQLDEVLAQSYAELLQAPDIQREVAAELPFDISAQELEGKVDVGVLAGTRLVEIKATDRDSARAQTIANTYARVFVGNRIRSADEAGEAQLTELNAQIARLVDRIDRLQARGGPGDEAKLAQSESELEAVRASYERTRQNSTLAGTNVSVSTQASLPTSPATPRPKLYLAIGFVLAFALAAAAAFVRDAFDKRVREEADVTDIIDAPILSRLPAAGRSPASNPSFGEAMQFLRANLPGDQDGVQVIAVTSAASQDGKTTVSAGLATALAEMGANVITVDCDLRRPMLAQRLNVEPGRGLTDVLRGRRTLDEVLVSGLGGHVTVLSAGVAPDNPSVVLTEPALRGVLSELREWGDVVVVDTPPVLAGAETAAILRAVDGVLVVVDLARARTDQLRATHDQLETSDANVIGVVLNRVSERRSVYAYYGYRRGDRSAADGARTGSAGERRREPAATEGAP